MIILRPDFPVSISIDNKVTILGRFSMVGEWCVGIVRFYSGVWSSLELEIFVKSRYNHIEQAVGTFKSFYSICKNQSHGLILCRK